MDMRLRQLSYSSLLTLHSCPRKYQLYKLQSQAQNTDTDGTQSITFAYGHAVGTGIQLLLQGQPLESVIWTTVITWPLDPMAYDEKRKKSLWLAIAALMRFEHIQKSGVLKDYELVWLDKNRPACELAFYIHLPGDFKYRGSVDAVLRHKVTGEILVLECKTTWFGTVSPAQYKNSSQAIGYSIILDSLFPELSSYKVLYLIYKTTAFEFESLEFTKTFLQRAQWIQELLFDVEDITRYENAGVYPMRGESCKSFGRDCEYFGICGLNTAALSQSMTDETAARYAAEESKADAVFTLEDLIHRQLERTS